MDSLCLSGILLTAISIIVFVIINRVKIGMMIGGGIVLFLALKFLAMMGGDVEISGASYGNSGSYTAGGSDSGGYDMSTSNNQSERISFANYDFSRGDFAKDFNRIDF